MALFYALPHVSFDEKDAFKQALKTTLVKDYTDIPVFDRCFEEFFQGVSAIVSNLDELEAMRSEKSLSPRAIKKLEDVLDAFLDAQSRDSIFEKKPEDLLKLFLEEQQQSGSSGGMGMALFQTRSTIGSSHMERGEGDGEGDGTEQLHEILLQLMTQKIRNRKVGKELKDHEDYLLNKFIYQLTPAEVKEMRELIRRFGQKLKNRISLRKKRVKHGGIDIKRTIRSSLEFGGIPFKLFYKDRRIDRPQLVVLCDVSGSVNQYTRFMLLLTHTLQGLFSKVRTFAFISNLVEITPLFMEMDPERAINTIFTDTDFTYGWGSNYGRCFDMFIDDFSDSLTGKTTVLVLGDARNNNQDPGLDSFIRIHDRSRNIFWLNPEKRHLWDWNDSIASLYSAYCTEMKEVNNFLDLSEFIDKLFEDYATA